MTRRHLATSPFKPPVVRPVEQYTAQDRVTHDTYGLGVVISVEQGAAVLVDFGSTTERIVAPYAKMTKL